MATQAAAAAAAASSITPNATAQTVAALLPKLHDGDPDYRFMCLNDLYQILTNGRPDLLEHDYNTAAKAVDGICKTLDDQNGEVQNLAIKCLGPLVLKLPCTVIPPLIEKLSQISTDNSVDNSIPALALRTVVTTLPRPLPAVSPGQEVNEAYSAISRVLIPRLTGKVVMPRPSHVKLPDPPKGMLELDDDKDIEAEAMDVLIEVVRCYGPMLLEPEIGSLQDTVVMILESEKASSVIKKRAVAAISILALFLSDSDLSGFVSQLIESFRNSHLTNVKRRMYITILGSMSRSIPSRFGPYLKTLAPFILAALSQKELDEQFENAAEDGEPDAEADDVREAALVALEGFLGFCGHEMRSFTKESIAASLRYLKYDPNYNHNEDVEDVQSDEDDDMGGLDEDEDFEADADFDDDDDDDASWKVRRCAAKALNTLIATRGSGDLLEDGTLYTHVAPVLINRFNEREENVRLEIIETVASLISKTGEGVMPSTLTDVDGLESLSTNMPNRKRRRSPSLDARTHGHVASGLVSPTIQPVPSSGPLADLAKLSPALVKAVTKLMKGKSVPTKQAALKLLSNLVSVQPGGLSEYFNQVVDPIVEAIGQSGSSTASAGAITNGAASSATVSTLRISALRLVSKMSETHSSSVLEPFLNSIIPAVVSAAKDKFHKISAEAISTIEHLVKALTPPRSMGSQQQNSIGKLYDVIIDRVSANNADLEVRQRAIHALSVLLSRTSSSQGCKLLPASSRATALDLLSDRLRNEITRLAAVRAIDDIAASTTGKDQLSPKWIRMVSLELAAQLRKADRALRGASLAALRNLITGPAARKSLDEPTIAGLVSALLPIVTPTDLHLLAPALLVLASLVDDEPNMVVTAELNVAICSLLFGTVGKVVLDAILVLVKNIGENGTGQPLMQCLLKDVGVRGDSAVLGKIVGTLLVCGGSSLNVTIDSFIGELQVSTADDNKSLALAVLGEYGLRKGGSSPLKPQLFTTYFASKSDKVPLAAAIALGRAGAGNVELFLPTILDLMENGGNTPYLPLHSIKEILQQSGGSSNIDLGHYDTKIWAKLLEVGQQEESKAVGAECIGRLTILKPQVHIPQLKALLSDPSSLKRAMAIQAVRYTLPENDETFDQVLKNHLLDMLVVMMNDADLENRRLALTTLNSAAHNKPDTILPNLNRLMPLIMRESVIKPELQREVMMGPFKHQIDDGLECRKSAYETLYSMMEIAFSRLNILEFYDRIVAGLADEHDIRTLCTLVLTKLIILNPDETARRLDSIAECFRTVLSIKLKETAVKQEIEKQNEAIKSVLRVSLLLHNAIPSASIAIGTTADQHPHWRNYWEWIGKDWDAQIRSLKMDGLVASS